MSLATSTGTVSVTVHRTFSSELTLCCIGFLLVMSVERHEFPHRVTSITGLD
jgi:hypothetical protein